MIRSIKAAYGAGWRAGMAKSVVQRKGGARDVKIIVEPLCPFAPFRFLRCLAWHQGYYNGCMRKFEDYKHGLM